GAFDHRGRAGIAHGEALAGNAADEGLSGDRAVEHGIADDDRFLRHDAGVDRRPYDDAPAREALADIVVALALELEGDAAREPGAEALTGGTGELDVDRIIGKPDMAVALGDLARKHRAGGTIGVGDRGHDTHRRAAVERGLRFGDQPAVEDIV